MSEVDPRKPSSARPPFAWEESQPVPKRKRVRVSFLKKVRGPRKVRVSFLARRKRSSRRR
jgi:hypothetical protein